jgi:hypothetical protein
MNIPMRGLNTKETVTCHCLQDLPLERSVIIVFYIFHFFLFFDLINANKNANIFGMVSCINGYFLTQTLVHDDQMGIHEIDIGAEEMRW